MLNNSPCHLEVRTGLKDLKQTLKVKPLPARPPAWFEIPDTADRFLTINPNQNGNYRRGIMNAN